MSLSLNTNMTFMPNNNYNNNNNNNIYLKSSIQTSSIDYKAMHYLKIN